MSSLSAVDEICVGLHGNRAFTHVFTFMCILNPPIRIIERIVYQFTTINHAGMYF